MKNYTNYILILWALVAAGCADFLSETPDNRATLEGKEKLAELLVTAYPEGNYAGFCEAMTDNVEDNSAGKKASTNADPYFWRDHSLTDQDTPDNYWADCYAAIAACNHALEYINAAADPTVYNAEKGEALVARAYSHFMLAALFAQTYSGTTADNTNPGIPYVTLPEKNGFVQYERGTVKSVYDRIEKDLTEGLPLIDDKVFTSGTKGTGVSKFHFTTAAAHAFATRFFLFRRDYDKVIEHANAVFTDGDFASRLRPWNTTYGTLSFATLIQTYTNSTETANLLLCETSSLWARSYNALQYSTGFSKSSEIFDTNVTGGRFAFSVYYNSSEAYFVPKYDEHFVQTGINTTTGFPYTIMPLLSAEEVLFNRAEAYAMKDNFTQALEDLNTWISKRVDGYSPQHDVNMPKLAAYYRDVTTARGQALSAILDFRRAEFIHEGLRWFDLLRYDIPVVHNVKGEPDIVLPAGDPRRVLQIPRDAIATGGLTANPR